MDFFVNSTILITNDGKNYMIAQVFYSGFHIIFTSFFCFPQLGTTWGYYPIKVTNFVMIKL
jgi:hypothetical protein